jgi:hypothetical protein
VPPGKGLVGQERRLSDGGRAVSAGESQRRGQLHDYCRYLSGSLAVCFPMLAASCRRNQKPGTPPGEARLLPASAVILDASGRLGRRRAAFFVIGRAASWPRKAGQAARCSAVRDGQTSRGEGVGCILWISRPAGTRPGQRSHWLPDMHAVVRAAAVTQRRAKTCIARRKRTSLPTCLDAFVCCDGAALECSARHDRVRDRAAALAPVGGWFAFSPRSFTFAESQTSPASPATARVWGWTETLVGVIP